MLAVLEHSATTLLLILLLTARIGFAAKAKGDATPIRASVCELAKHPERFDGKQVTIPARYFTTWEWGSSLVDARCATSAVKFLAPGAYDTPPQYKKLRDARTDRDFNDKASVLCNGWNLLCDFDYLEAEFTGIFVAARRLARPESGLVVTSVSNAKLHANEHRLLVPSEIPNELPSAGEKRPKR